MMTSRRISLPALRHYSPNRLSPKRFTYLKDISEFEIEPPFISSIDSSSSSADASPRRMLSPLRPASARPYRRRRKLERETWAAVDYDDDDDIFGTNYSSSHSPSPQPAYSLRSSPQPPQTSSTCSSSSVAPNETAGTSANNDENDARNLFLTDRYYTEPPPNSDQSLKQNQQMRSFNVDTKGKIVDCGFRMGRQSRPLTRTNKSRRATCPEIWLSSADEENKPITQCILRIFGGTNVGKKSIANQMAAHADISAYQDLNIDFEELDLPPTNIINFMMNEDEVQLEIIQGTAPDLDNRMTIYMVIYSIDSRESFIRAAQILYRLHDSRRLAPGTPVVLVANKMDLQRKRKVTFVEGKMLAKIYKAAFVETSSLLAMNMDQVWEETLRKFQKFKAMKERQLRALKSSASPIKPSSNHLMGRIVKQGRRFAKSCEEIVAKLAAL